MDILFSAHSGVRYLVLFSGLIALAWFVWGKAAGRPFTRPAPALLAVFIGLFDIQILLGLALLIGGRRPPGIWGHVALMLSAGVFVHVINKRRKGKTGYGLPLLGVAGALALIVVGILSIGRPLL
ncbi:MAG TPA: hypothetical protein VEY33_04140 [Gemmatimonadota bacterium]|nr:hypothetical protein [Gemmatimonadota bacterium]